MANLQNNVMIEVEQELDLCLNEKEMTNEQALNHIEKELGTYKRDCKDDYFRKTSRRSTYTILG